jgi:hypothetical protein
MGAVDPHDIHACSEQFLDQLWVVRCLTRHRDHDPDDARRRCRTEQASGVIVEQYRTCLKRRGWLRSGLRIFSRKNFEIGYDGVDRG